MRLVVSHKRLLVEIYANVLNKRVVVIDSSNASALGAAMLGANVGNAYSTLKEAALSMKQPIAYIQEPEIQKFKLINHSTINIVNYMIY